MPTICWKNSDQKLKKSKALRMNAGGMIPIGRLEDGILCQSRLTGLVSSDGMG